MGLRSLFRDPWVSVTFFPAATLLFTGHFPIKIREVKIFLTQHSVNAHTKPFKPWEAKTVWACLSHTGGLIWRKLFLESVRSEPIFIWIPAQLNGNNILLVCNPEKFWCSIELGQARCKRIFQGSLALLASSEFATSCQKRKVWYMRSNRMLRLKYYEGYTTIPRRIFRAKPGFPFDRWKKKFGDRSDHMETTLQRS